MSNATYRKVMLLVDADNVSVDVIQQAFDRVMAQHGAAHIRRAYCTAESAAKHLPLFKRLSMRPIVNVSTGKNSTDIALAVDAIGLAEAERPDLVVIVSSDSDFAPLVIRLREKGCRVEGIGQKGKTGEDSTIVYDDFVDIEHRKSAAAKTPARGRGAGRKTSAAAPAAPAPVMPPPAPKAAPQTPAPAAAAEPTEAAERAPAKRGRRGAKSTPAEPERASSRADLPLPAPVAPPVPRLSEEVLHILEAVPELAEGGKIELSLAAERLRVVQMLAKNAPSTKLFRKYPEHFVLSPEKQPNKVEYRGPAPW
jgi:hypothetical protein